MNRDQLYQRHAAAIRRHWRTLTDNGGQPPQQLLDDLAAIASQHAADLTPKPAVTTAVPAPIDATTRAALPPAEQVPVGAEHAAAPRKAAPRRNTTARRTAK